MALARYSAKIDSDGRVRVIHIFLGESESAVDAAQQKHADGCKAYGPAFEEEKTIDIDANVDELPEADEESLLEFLELGDEEPDSDDDTEEDEGADDGEEDETEK
jgi:hypothetical protein